MEKRQQRGLFTVPGLLLALKLSLMVVIYLPGQHGLQRGHPDAAGSEKNHNGEGHPASRRERQQDVAQRVGRHAGDNGLLLAETFGGGTSDEGLSEGVQDSEYRKRQADHRRAPAKAVLAENDPERCRHLSYELHDKEDSHKCGDDSHAPRPPEGADWVEGSQGHRSTDHNQPYHICRGFTCFKKPPTPPPEPET